MLSTCAENGTYSVCNLCSLKVDVQITIGHSRDLINFTEGLAISRKKIRRDQLQISDTTYSTPFLNSVQTPGVVQRDTTDDELPLFGLSRRTAQRRQRKTGRAGLPSEQDAWVRIVGLFYEDLI